MAEHAPIPWSYSADDKFNPDRAFGIVHEIGPDETGTGEPGTVVIAEVTVGDTAEADAQFIVRACNNHDNLLAAAKRSLELHSLTLAVHKQMFPGERNTTLEEAIRFLQDTISATEQ